ncbi:MAG: hypothetical protein K9J42_06650 [Sulfuritalea sp.]|nr:hypothetical protein [Sulfuritalea sp.]
MLYNSYYNAVGDRHPLPQRGLLTRPSLESVPAFRADVDDRMQKLLSRNTTEFGELVILGLHHEQQHQELLLTDIKHLFSCSPLSPVYREVEPAKGQAPALSWQNYASGLTEIGHQGNDFCYDNETPRHNVFLPGFQLASRLISNAEFQVFIDGGGYTDPAYWLAE